MKAWALTWNSCIFPENLTPSVLFQVAACIRCPFLRIVASTTEQSSKTTAVQHQDSSPSGCPLLSARRISPKITYKSPSAHSLTVMHTAICLESPANGGVESGPVSRSRKTLLFFFYHRGKVNAYRQTKSFRDDGGLGEGADLFGHVGGGVAMLRNSTPPSHIFPPGDPHGPSDVLCLLQASLQLQPKLFLLS